MGKKKQLFSLTGLVMLTIVSLTSCTSAPNRSEPSPTITEPPTETVTVTPTPSVVSVYLSDFAPIVANAAGGNFCIGRSPVGDPPRCSASLLLEGKTLSHSIFAHADSTVEFALNGEYNLFRTALVMLGGECGDGAIFAVFLDDAEIFRSGRITYQTPPVDVELDVTDGRLLRLETYIGPSNDLNCDGSVWGEPILEKPYSAEADVAENIATPIPTLDLPLAWQTPAPQVGSVINKDSIHQLVELIQINGYGFPGYVTRLSSDGNFAFVRDEAGLDIYAYPSYDHLYHFNFNASGYDAYQKLISLDVSSDNDWAVVDSKYLLHFVMGQEPEVQLLDLGERAQGYTDKTGILNTQNASYLVIRGRELIDLKTNETVYLWGGGYSAMHGIYQISNDGSLVLGRVDNRFAVWDFTSGEIIASFTGDRTSKGGISPSGKYFGLLELHELTVWDVASGDLVGTATSDCVNAIPVFSPNEEYVALVSDAPGRELCEVSIYPLTGGKALTTSSEPVGRQVIIRDDGRISYVENPQHYVDWQQFNSWLTGFAPDGSIFINTFRKSCLIDTRFTLNCESGEFGKGHEHFQGPDGSIYHLNNPYDQNYTSREIDIFEGYQGTGEPAYSISFSDYGFSPSSIDTKNRLLFYTVWHNPNSPDSYVLDYFANATVATFSGVWIDNVQISPTGLFSVCVEDNNTVTIDRLVFYDTVTKKRLGQRAIHCPSGGATMTMMTDGHYFVAEEDSIDANSRHHALLIIDLTNDFEEIVLPYECDITATAFTNDDKVLVVACDDLTLRFYDTTSWEEFLRFRTGLLIDRLDFSTDGTRMLSATNNGLSVWVSDPGLWESWSNQRIYNVEN